MLEVIFDGLTTRPALGPLGRRLGIRSIRGLVCALARIVGRRTYSLREVSEANSLVIRAESEEAVQSVLQTLLVNADSSLVHRQRRGLVVEE